MKLKAAVFGLAALGGAALTAGTAAAMPNGLPQAKQVAGQAANVEQVRWVCNGFGRCWWRPGPRVVWGPRPVWGPRWRGAYAWGPGPVWGPRPGWGWRRGWWW